ncbi:MAG: type II toxin-antitoxin system prevent-host-death family antitoxin [Dermatophilus congolensis]|nr:type II toxin-antitoxin system prevent-host-death family antitoxin [Dermatophilus congolensis]
MSAVTVRDLRNRSADVLARVARGEALTVTRDGEPVAAVVPLPRRALGTRELIARRAGLPRVNPDDLRRDIDEILDAAL